MPQGTSRAENSHLRLAPANPLSQVPISALIPDAVPNWVPIKESKPVKPICFFPCTECFQQITLQELDSDEHILLARLSSVHYLYNVRLLPTYRREKQFVNIVYNVSAFD
jgi:hypothetical protein